MSLSSWLCTNSTKNLLIKIVHPGGHVELHDRPVLAAEIMLRNPRCIVAYPHVFKQPWAIIAPETTLLLGQKYYVVPIGTIRKLQRLSFKNSPSPLNENQSEKPRNNEESDDHVEKQGCFKDGNCLIITGMKTKGNNHKNGEDSSDGTKSSSSLGSSETKGLTRMKKTKKKKNRINKDAITKGSPKTLSNSIDNWQPNLESITEE